MKQTLRESYVKVFYSKMGIYDPVDIDEWRIADFWGIDIIYHYGDPHFFHNTIYLNANLHPKEQRVHFFHELAHIIRQSTGNQLFEPTTMSDYLEWDADIFALYACLPWHMVRLYDLTDEDLPCHLSNDFVVPHDMVYKRLHQIKQRLTI